MRDFASNDALQEREELFTELSWGHDFGHIPEHELPWVRDTNVSGIVYKLQENESCVIEVTMTSKVWRKIQRLSDQYHHAGRFSQRGYMPLEDVLEWMGPQPLRWWRRFGGMIRLERARRRNPTLFRGFEVLAESAEKYFTYRQEK